MFCKLPKYDKYKSIISIGGLSESGKSTLGRILFEIHNIPNFKFKYIDLVIKQKYSLSGKNNLFDNDIAYLNLLMIEEILNILQSMYYWDIISFESLHDFKAAKLMKDLLGNKNCVVYIETSLDNRVRRNATELGVTLKSSEDGIIVKDSDKISVGADRVKEIADVIIKNNGDFENLSFQISRVINKIRGGNYEN